MIFQCVQFKLGIAKLPFLTQCHINRVALLEYFKKHTFSVHPIRHRQEDLPRRIVGKGQHLYILRDDAAESQVWRWPFKAEAEPRGHHHGDHQHAETVSRQSVAEEVKFVIIGLEMELKTKKKPCRMSMDRTHLFSWMKLTCTNGGNLFRGTWAVQWFFGFCIKCTEYRVTIHLCKTCRWLQNESSALAWPGRAKAELSFWRKWEVLHKQNGHPVLSLKIGMKCIFPKLFHESCRFSMSLKPLWSVELYIRGCVKLTQEARCGTLAICVTKW